MINVKGTLYLMNRINIFSCILLVQSFASVHEMYICLQPVGHQHHRNVQADNLSSVWPIFWGALQEDVTYCYIHMTCLLFEKCWYKFLINYANYSVSDIFLHSWINRTTTNPTPTSNWPWLKLVTANTKCWINDRTRYRHPYSSQGSR